MGNHNTGFEIDAAVRHRRLLGFTAAGLLAGGLALGGLIAALQALAPDVSYRPAIALGLYAVIAGAMLFGLRHHAPHRRLGLANAITLARAVLTCLLAGLLLLIGHGLNLALAIMSGFVHGLRLNYIEFFRWSVPEEGHPFQAFARRERPAGAGEGVTWNRS